jgi:hypothetical protein
MPQHKGGLLAGFKSVPDDDALSEVADKGTLAATGNSHHRNDNVSRSAKSFS